MISRKATNFQVPLPARKFQAEGIRQFGFSAELRPWPLLQGSTGGNLYNSQFEAEIVGFRILREFPRNGRGKTLWITIVTKMFLARGWGKRRDARMHRIARLKIVRFYTADRNSPGLTRSSSTSGCPYVARMPRHLVIFPPGVYLPQEISSSWLSVGFPFVERKRRKRGTPSLKHLSPDQCVVSPFYFSFFRCQVFNIAIDWNGEFYERAQWFNHDYKLVRLWNKIT